MADTTIKLSGTYDSIEAYELLEEMRGVASDYLPLAGGEISGDLIVDGQLSADLTGNVTGNVTGTASGNLPLSGGTMTGDITLTDGGKALSSAVVGKVVTKSVSSSVSLTASTAKTITSISLTAGTWVITGHCQYTTNTANRIYGVTIATSGNSYSYSNDGSVAIHSSLTGTIALQTTIVLVLASNSTVYLNGYATVAATVSSGDITAVRIV